MEGVVKMRLRSSRWESNSDEETIYSKKKREALLDEEGIKSEEDGFMEGYGEELDFTEEEDFLDAYEEELFL